MKVDFFQNKCKLIVSHEIFGICDVEGSRAYCDPNNKDSWIATIKNPKKLDITFIAVDHCLDLRRADNKPSKKCDGILSFDKSIIFLELKNRKSKKAYNWIKKGVDQLEKSIEHFKLNHDLKVYDSHIAVLANCKKPNFGSSQSSRKNLFKQKNGVSLQINPIIFI